MSNIDKDVRSMLMDIETDLVGQRDQFIDERLRFWIMDMWIVMFRGIKDWIEEIRLQL